MRRYGGEPGERTRGKELQVGPPGPETPAPTPPETPPPDPDVFLESSSQADR